MGRYWVHILLLCIGATSQTHDAANIANVLKHAVDAANAAGAEGDLEVVVPDKKYNEEQIIVVQQKEDRKGALEKEEDEIDHKNGVHINGIKGHANGQPGAVISLSNNREEDTKILKMDDLISSKKEKIMSEEFLIIAILILVTWAVESNARDKGRHYLQMPNIAATLSIIIGTALVLLPLDISQLKDYLDFNDDLFFMALLPLIIFESALNINLHRREGTFLAILYFAFLGTLLSFIFTGSFIFLFWSLLPLEEGMKVTLKASFSFAALISATDPVSVIALFKNMTVHPFLEAVVLGESLMNDALSISMYRTITRSQATTLAEAFLSFCFLFFLAIFIGVTIGGLPALLAKSGRFTSSRIQLALILLFPYIAYLIAESFGSSGIVAILFSGITINRYCIPNLAPQLQCSIKDMVGSLSIIAETVAFLFLGLGVFFIDLSIVTWLAAGVASIIVVSGARYISIWITTKCYSYLHESTIPTNIQQSLTLCGLRGAVALGLAKHARHDYGHGIGSLILASALCYSLFTVMIIGPLVPWCLRYLEVMGNIDTEGALQFLNKNSLIEYLVLSLDTRLETFLSSRHKEVTQDIIPSIEVTPVMTN